MESHMRTLLLVVARMLLMLLCGASFVVQTKRATPMSDRCGYSPCEDRASPRPAVPVSAALQRAHLRVPTSLILLCGGIVLLRAGLAMRHDGVAGSR